MFIFWSDNSADVYGVAILSDTVVNQFKVTIIDRNTALKLCRTLSSTTISNRENRGYKENRGYIRKSVFRGRGLIINIIICNIDSRICLI
jgi:hypothetical protein